MPFIFRPAGWLPQPLGHEGGGTATLRGDHATSSVSPVVPGSHSQSFCPYTLPSSRSQQHSHIHMSSWSRLTIRSALVLPYFWVTCPLCRLIWPGRLSLDIMLCDHRVLDRNSDRGRDHPLVRVSSVTRYRVGWFLACVPVSPPHTVGACEHSPRVYYCPHQGRTPCWHSEREAWHAVNCVSPGLTIGSR